ncbi:MAG TPA: phosphotransferase [Solirubrobacterales bacterium]|nr:phosphotransferase [Solirubrobacterales bacterium]
MSQLSETVERLSATLGPAEGEPAPLEGGITNRNYRLRFGGREVVVRMPGKDTGMLGIDRSAERAANECAARAGMAPGVAAMLEDPPCLVTDFVEGEAMSAEQLRRPEGLAEVAVALRKLHGCGETLPSEFSAFRVVETYAERARSRGAKVPADFGPAHKAAAAIEAALAARGEPPVPCHNDLLAANFIDSPEGLRIVDWEYAGMGDRWFDLGNFAVNNELGPAEEERFLAAYLGRAPEPSDLRALRSMRFMSDFREAMWAVLQGTLSDLDFDFAAYAAKHFKRLEDFGAKS